MDNKECAKKIFKELCGAGFLFKFYFTLRELTGYTHFTEFLWECPDDKIIGAMDNMHTHILNVMKGGFYDLPNV